MLRRPLAAAATAIRLPRGQPIRLLGRRRYATGPPPPLPSSASRIARVETRLPRFLRRYTVPLRDAPLSHITAFLVLHELTAIVPLFGLAAAFHYANWLPPFFSEGKWVKDGVEKFGRYLRKKGWISDREEKEIEESEAAGYVSARWWDRGEGGVRIVVELATAYAVTKALLPLRLVVSVWATPWFARWTVLPLKNAVKRVFGRKKASPAAATGAVGGGTLPTDAGSRVK